MICRKCKRAIPDESAFCNICGAKQTIAPHPKKRGNGQGTVSKLPSGKWQAIVTLGYYTDAKGKRHRRKKTKVFVKKSDAIAALPSLKGTVAHPKDVPLRTLYDQYTNSTEYKNLSRSLRHRYELAWVRWKPIEFTGISVLTVADIEAQIKKQATSFNTAFDMQVLLSHLYKLAIKQEIIQYNKCTSVDLPYQKPAPKRQVWTDKEVDAFWVALPDYPIMAPVLIMCYAGLRFGEISTIKLSDIHLDEGYMIGGIKSEAGIDRQIPIHTRIRPLIEQAMRTNKFRLYEFSQQQFYGQYYKALSAINVRALPPHTCRHYFFSRLTAAGVQGGIIAEVGGHADYNTTIKNYVRISLADKIAAVNQI